MLLEYNPIQGKVADTSAYKTLRPMAPLNRWVHSYWQLTAKKGRFQYHSVPDNCVDWIININCFDDNFLIPPFLSSTLFNIDGPASYFGIRFRVLGHQGLISYPLGEWVDAGSMKAEELIPKSVVYSVFEVINNAIDFETRCKSLSAVILSAISFNNVDPRLARYIRYCYENITDHVDLHGSGSAKFDLSSRQLRRLSKQHIGLLPKDFRRVLKFQSTLTAMHSPQDCWAYLDYYYDQPHFIREFKRLSGVTPTQFRKMSVLYNHSLSE